MANRFKGGIWFPCVHVSLTARIFIKVLKNYLDNDVSLSNYFWSYKSRWLCMMYENGCNCWIVNATLLWCSSKLKLKIYTSITSWLPLLRKKLYFIILMNLTVPLATLLQFEQKRSRLTTTSTSRFIISGSRWENWLQTVYGVREQ